MDGQNGAPVCMKNGRNSCGFWQIDLLGPQFPLVVIFRDFPSDSFAALEHPPNGCSPHPVFSSSTLGAGGGVRLQRDEGGAGDAEAAGAVHKAAAQKQAHATTPMPCGRAAFAAWGLGEAPSIENKPTYLEDQPCQVPRQHGKGG